jgi:hypothetical protein
MLLASTPLYSPVLASPRRTIPPSIETQPTKSRKQIADIITPSSKDDQPTIPTTATKKKSNSAHFFLFSTHSFVPSWTCICGCRSWGHNCSTELANQQREKEEAGNLSLEVYQ